MHWLKRIGRGFLVLLALMMLFLTLQYLWVGGPGEADVPETPVILAHRGVHHNYQVGAYDWQTGCEAQHLFPPTHAYLENTLPAIQAAFEAGATMVEIDLRKTADSNLVVFHDIGLACRTDGEGWVRDHTVAELKALDIGYGYTADGGKSFPFRGTGLGWMPTLAEVLEAFPERSFLLDHKDWDETSLQILIRILSEIPEAQRARLWFWSSATHQASLQAVYPEIQPLFLTRKEAKQIVGPFFFSFGLIGIPEKYHGRVMAIPREYVPYIWGWPYRFARKIRAAGLQLYLMVDTEDAARTQLSWPVDGFVTDYIERTGPILSTAR